MVPIFAIVGRPNVGKSTLYNKLTKTRDALVYNRPGVTRDCQHGRGRLGSSPYWVIDTGGITEGEEALDDQVADAAWQAIFEADIILLVVDAKEGITPLDHKIVSRLRQTEKPVHIVANKIDGSVAEIVTAEFYQLGFEHLHPIAAAHNRGLSKMMDALLEPYAQELPEPEVMFEDEFLTTEEALELDEPIKAADEEEQDIRVAIVGRPNVGKSSLVNRLLGEEKVVAFDLPGTTRDSIAIPFSNHQGQFTLVDTAGIRRKKSIIDTVETFSIIKALQAIDKSNVVVLVIDAQLGLVEQDMKLLDSVIEAGRALVLAVNKWDNLEDEQKVSIKKDIADRLKFCDFAQVFYISALHGTNVGYLLPAAKKAYQAAMLPMSTAHLTALLQQAVMAHPTPRHQNRQIKLRFAHCGGHNPPIIIIHGNQTSGLTDSYLRYLNGFFRKALKLEGTPLKVICRTGENPYAGKRNKLTPRQLHKRGRIVKHRKKEEKRKQAR